MRQSQGCLNLFKEKVIHMLQTDLRGLRLHLGESEGLAQIMDMVKDAEKFARKSGNFHIKSKRLYPAKPKVKGVESDLKKLFDLVKVDVDKYLREKYLISSPCQYATMVTKNVLDCFPRRMVRFPSKTKQFQSAPRVSCNWNLIPPISPKQSVQIDPNKAKLVVDSEKISVVNTEGETVKISSSEINCEFIDEDFTILNGVYFAITGPKDVKVKIPVVVPTRQLYLVTDSNFLNKLTGGGKTFERRCGGWLTLAENGRTFFLTKLVTYEWETSYEPEGVIGFDYNARRQVFMTFDRPIVTVDGDVIDFSLEGESNYLPLPGFVADALDELGQINSKLKKQTGDGEKRNRELHLRRKQLHRISTNYFKPIAIKLVKFITENRLILGVDDLAQGERTSVGHMNFSQFLLKELRRKKACFVVVPTPYTSMYCAKCVCESGEYVKNREIHVDKTTGKNTVQCDNLHTQDRDINAANNIAFDAEYLFYNNFMRAEKESPKQAKIVGIQRVDKGTPMLLTNIEARFRTGYIYDYDFTVVTDADDEDEDINFYETEDYAYEPDF